MLFGVHLFLRGNEIMDLGLLSLMEENTICDNYGTIAGLFVQILGKTEKKIYSRNYDDGLCLLIRDYVRLNI